MSYEMDLPAESFAEKCLPGIEMVEDLQQPIKSRLDGAMASQAKRVRGKS